MFGRIGRWKPGDRSGVDWKMDLSPFEEPLASGHHLISRAASRRDGAGDASSVGLGIASG